jgi:hypothetical protein
MNPTANDVIARFALAGVEALVDAMGEARIACAAGAFEVNVPSRVVRVMVVEGYKSR